MSSRKDQTNTKTDDEEDIIVLNLSGSLLLPCDLSCKLFRIDDEGEKHLLTGEVGDVEGASETTAKVSVDKSVVDGVDEERAAVGTTYKQKGRDKAVLLGFDFVGTKWRGFIEQALKIAPEKRVFVHCWQSSAI